MLYLASHSSYGPASQHARNKGIAKDFLSLEPISPSMDSNEYTEPVLKGRCFPDKEWFYTDFRRDDRNEHDADYS